MGKHIAAPGTIAMRPAPLVEDPQHRMFVELEHVNPWGIMLTAEDARILKQEDAS